MPVARVFPAELHCQILSCKIGAPTSCIYPADILRNQLAEPMPECMWSSANPFISVEGKGYEGRDIGLIELF